MAPVWSPALSGFAPISSPTRRTCSLIAHCRSAGSISVLKSRPHESQLSRRKLSRSALIENANLTSLSVELSESIASTEVNQFRTVAAGQEWSFPDCPPQEWYRAVSHRIIDLVSTTYQSRRLPYSSECTTKRLRVARPLVTQAHFFVVIWGVSSKLIPTHMSCGWLGAAPMACREGAGQVARASSTCFREQRTHLQRDALAWSSTVAGGAQASGRAESGAGREPLAAGRRNGGWPRAGTGTRAGSG